MIGDKISENDMARSKPAVRELSPRELEAVSGSGFGYIIWLGQQNIHPWG